MWILKCGPPGISRELTVGGSPHDQGVPPGRTSKAKRGDFVFDFANVTIKCVPVGSPMQIEAGFRVSLSCVDSVLACRLRAVAWGMIG